MRGMPGYSDPPPIHLDLNRVTLEPLDESRWEELKGILSDPEVLKGLLGDCSTPRRLEKTASQWFTPAEFWNENRFGMWAIIDKGAVASVPGRMLGLAGADAPPPPTGIGPETFYFLGRAAWGKGVAMESMRAICQYLFEEIDVPAVEALIFAKTNPGSVALAQRLGMKLVGRSDIVGHHLDRQGALETMEFDVWRVRQATPPSIEDTIRHASFRIGQLLGEGVWELEPAQASIQQAAMEAGYAGSGLQLESLVRNTLKEGMDARGFSHFRLLREDWEACHSKSGKVAK